MSKLSENKSLTTGDCPDPGEWNTEATLSLSKTTTNVCFWEQKIDAYVQLLGLYWNGGLPDPNDPDPPAPNLVKLINLDRPYNIVAQNNLFIVSAADGSTTPYAFQFGGIAAPQAVVCKRDTECNQIVKIVEHSVHVNGGQNLLVPGTLITAIRGNLIIALPDPICEDSSSNSASSLKVKLLEASKKVKEMAKSDNVEKMPSLSVRVE
jgi:hypothetical protein